MPGIVRYKEWIGANGLVSSLLKEIHACSSAPVVYCVVKFRRNVILYFNYPKNSKKMGGLGM